MEAVDVGDMVKVTCSLDYNERQHILSLEAQSMEEISSANLVIDFFFSEIHSPSETSSTVMSSPSLSSAQESVLSSSITSLSSDDSMDLLRMTCILIESYLASIY
jgi:hypothetical protein